MAGEDCVKKGDCRWLGNKVDVSRVASGASPPQSMNGAQSVSVPATKTTTGIGIKRHANLRDDFLIQLSLAVGHTTTNILPTTAHLQPFNYLTQTSRHHSTLE